MKMKKLRSAVLASICCLTPAMAADVYMGLDLSGALQTIKGGVTSDLRETSSTAKLKVGFGEDDSFKYQFRLDYVRFNGPLFDDKHEVLYETSFDFIKEVHAQEDISPYVKLGVGYGFMPIDGASKKRIGEVVTTAGLGISFKTMEALYVVTGFDYTYRFWQDIEYMSTASKTLSTKSYGLGLYVGLNYKF